jgi:citrate lyase subunit beta/citryl-CoA lyase
MSTELKPSTMQSHTSPYELIRSLLFVPASSDRFIAKAHERGADAVILDLEDSVARSEKRAARERLAKAVPSAGQNGAKVFVRINSEDDLIDADAEAACRAGAYGLFRAKTPNAAAVLRLATLLDRVESEIGAARKTVIVPAIEDPNAVFEARAIGAASPRVYGLIAASEDMATVMDAEPSLEFVRLPKLLVHFAAKAVGVRSLGLLRSIADFRNVEGIKKAVEEARSFGFDGSTCIHPSVVAILNEGFSPSAVKVEEARRMLAAYEEAQKRGEGAFSFEGKMVDEPVVERAKRLLARAAQFGK